MSTEHNSNPSAVSSLLPQDEDTQLCLSLISAPKSTGNLALPGASSASTRVLTEKLKHNFLHNNAFFAGKVFHNHAMDHILAVYGLGGSPEAIQEVYLSHDYNDAVQPSPKVIIDANFFEHLGDADYFYAYTVYFCKALQNSSPSAVLNKFIFSSAYNYNPNLAATTSPQPITEDMHPVSSGPQQPMMLDRLLEGVLHPLIHIGYGVEFGITQQLADGLAHVAIHPVLLSSIVPTEFFTHPDPLLRGFSSSQPQTSQPPYLSFLAQLLSDPRLSPDALKLPAEDDNGGPSYIAVLQSEAGSVVKELADKWYDAWILGVSDDELEDRIEGMVEDVLVGNAVMYGISGYGAKGDKVFNADFFAMHFATSANFIPCLCLRPERTRAQTLNPPLPLSSRLILLRTYLSSITLWFLARQRPTASSFTSAIAAFYAATDGQLSPAPPAHAYAPGAPPKRSFSVAEGQKTMPAGSRAWPRIFANATCHPNEHLPKLVRALGAADTWYGTREQGEYGGALDGAEVLDGTVFLRCALLSMERLGWAAEEEPKALWDHDGFGSIAGRE